MGCAQKLESSKKMLRERGIRFTEHNEGAHIKIGAVNFWPGTGKWMDAGGIKGDCIETLLEYIRPPVPMTGKIWSTDEIFDIAKKVYPSNLYKICEAIHDALYRQYPSKP